jgi:hypothetical protein
VSQLLVVDPAKRLSAREVLAHPWLVAGSASSAPLTSAAEQLRRFNARRRLKHGVRKIMAAHAFAKMGKLRAEGGQGGGSPSPTSPGGAGSAAAGGSASSATSPVSTPGGAGREQ